MKEFADDNSNLMKMTETSPNGLKTLWEKEKLLVTSNFSFSRSVFKRLVLQTPKIQGLFGKGLILNPPLLFPSPSVHGKKCNLPNSEHFLHNRFNPAYIFIPLFFLLIWYKILLEEDKISCWLQAQLPLDCYNLGLAGKGLGDLSVYF